MSSSKPQAHVSEIVESSEEVSNNESFSSSEIQTLKGLLSQLESKPTTVASSNFVKSSTSLLANLDKSFWVIDSGANKHMTGFSNKFFTFHAQEKKKFV